MTQLNHRVLLEKPQVGEDSVGQPLTGWAPLGKRWADVKVLSGLAVIRAGAESSIVKASVRFNHGTVLEAGMRITYDGMVYDVKAVLPMSDRRYVDCVCEAAR
jgi:SPP1 family predicted phage head-tail adaptor